jgi:hypothetical protein
MRFVAGRGQSTCPSVCVCVCVCGRAALLCSALLVSPRGDDVAQSARPGPSAMARCRRRTTTTVIAIVHASEQDALSQQPAVVAATGAAETPMANGPQGDAGCVEAVPGARGRRRRRCRRCRRTNGRASGCRLSRGSLDRRDGRMPADGRERVRVYRLWPAACRPAACRRRRRCRHRYAVRRSTVVARVPSSRPVGDFVLPNEENPSNRGISPSLSDECVVRGFGSLACLSFPIAAAGRWVFDR